MTKKRKSARDDFDVELLLLPLKGIVESASVVVKKTYEVRDNQLVLGAPEPLELEGPFEPVGSDLPFKHAVDIAVLGSAYARDRRPFKEHSVRVSVAGATKRVRVLGRRYAEWTDDHVVSFGDIEAVESVPMTIEHAYGGTDRGVSEPEPKDLAAVLLAFALPVGTYPRNPHGKGFVLRDSSARIVELPQLEDPDDPLRPETLLVESPSAWFRQPLPWFTEWQHPGCFPRAWYAGVDLRFPPPPEELLSEVARGLSPTNWRQLRGRLDAKGGLTDLFFQDASLGLCVSAIAPGSRVLVEGMTWDTSALEFALPSPPAVVIEVGGRSCETQAELMNVVLKPNERAVTLTWSATCSTLPQRFIREIQHNIPVRATVDGIVVLPRLERPFWQRYEELRQQAAASPPRGDAAIELAGAVRSGEPRRERDHVPRSLAPKMGHIDPAAGRVLLEEVDWVLDGSAPFAFTRFYSSSMSWRVTSLGRGWTHCLEQEVWEEAGSIFCRLADGQEIEVSLARGSQLEIGARAFHAATAVAVRRSASDAYEVQTSSSELLSFRKIAHAVQVGPVRARLTRISRADGSAFEIGYDVYGRLERLSFGLGCEARFEHDSNGLLRRVFLPTRDGRDWALAMRYEMSADGQLSEVGDGGERSVSYGYQGGVLVSRRPDDGPVQRFEYLGAGATARAVRETAGVVSRGREFSYRPKEGVAGIRDSLGSSFSLQCSETYAVIRVADRHGNVTTREYDQATGLLSTETTELGESVWLYDAQRRLAEVSRPDGGSIGIDHDHEGRFARAKDPDGHAASWSWDPLGRITASRDRVGASIVFEYENDGALRALVAPGDTTLVLEREPNSRAISALRTPAGRRSARRDALLRVVEITREDGSMMRYGYDARGRVIEDETPGAILRKYEIDARGGIVRVHDGTTSVRMERDGTGRLVQIERGGPGERLHRDAEARVTMVESQNAGLFELVHDAMGRMIEEKGYEEGQGCHVLRDAHSNVKRELRGGRATEVTRDRAARPTELTHGDGTFQRFAWTLGGKLERAQDADRIVELTHDGEARPILEKADEHWVQSRYDARGNRVEYSSSLGLRVRVERDLYNTATLYRAEIGERVIELRFERDACGRELKRHLPGGLEVKWTRDPIGRPLERAVVYGGNTLATLRFAWAGLDRLIRVEDPARGAREHAHDARGNLVRVGAVIRATDDVGNVYRALSKDDHKYAPGGRIEDAYGTVYRYDGAGRRTEKETPDGAITRFKWDGRDRLIEVSLGESRRVAYDYDALGRLVRRRLEDKVEIPGVDEPVWEPLRETRFVWDGLTLLHEIEGRQVTTWLWEAGHLIGKIDAGGMYAALTDAIGLPTELIDERGNVAWRGSVDAFGVLSKEAEQTSCPWRLPGHYEDPDTGLAHSLFRVYDPETGAYLTSNPLGIAAGSNLYSYLPDPLSHASPLGLSRGYETFVGEFRSERLAAELITFIVAALDRKDGAAGPRSRFDPEDALLKLPDPEAVLWGPFESYRPHRRLPPPTSSFFRLPDSTGLNGS